MLKLLKEALSCYIVATRYVTIEKVCYGAVAFACEQQAKNGFSDDVRTEQAISYVRRFFPDMKREEVLDHLDAMQARLVGVGAHPKGKIA